MQKYFSDFHNPITPKHPHILAFHFAPLHCSLPPKHQLHLALTPVLLWKSVSFLLSTQPVAHTPVLPSFFKLHFMILSDTNWRSSSMSWHILLTTRHPISSLCTATTPVLLHSPLGYIFSYFSSHLPTNSSTSPVSISIFSDPNLNLFRFLFSSCPFQRRLCIVLKEINNLLPTC